MVPDSDTRSASAPHAVGRVGMGVPLWPVVLLVLIGAVGSGSLAAWLTRDALRAERVLRPPVILFDMAAAVRGAEPARLGAVVAHGTAQAKRLAEGGFLVLDAQAVIAAPPDLYLAPTATPEDAGDSPP